MKLESELWSITIGELSVHDYFTNIKKLADLLEGICEKVKEKNIVIHAINILSSKFETTVGIILHSKPLPTFDEARFMLLVEEQRLLTNRVPSPSNDNHSSSPQILHTSTNNSNRGGGNTYRRNSNQGRGNNRRFQPPSVSVVHNVGH